MSMRNFTDAELVSCMQSYAKRHEMKFEFTKLRRSIVDSIRRAAQHIRTYGWCTGYLSLATGECCTIGAFCNHEDREHIGAVLGQRVCTFMLCDGVYDGLHRWNDVQPDMETVIRELRACADRVEAITVI